MMKRSFGLKAVALAVAIMGFAVAESAAQCSHTPQVVVSNAGPGPWTASYTFTGAETDVINSELSSCLTGTDTPETVFEFTAPATGIYNFDTLTSTLGGDPDTQMWIFTNCGDPVGTEVGCSDDISGADFLSAATVSLTASTTYFIAVEAWLTTTNGEVAVLNIEFAPPPPANDLCAGATPLTLPFTETANLALCNDEGLDNTASVGAFGGLGADVFYTFTPATTGSYAFLATGVDAGIAHYTGSCGTLTEVAAVDATGGGEKATWTLTSGTAYTFMAEGYDPSVTGVMTVAFNAVSGAPSTGFDNCNTPHQVNVSPFTETIDMSGNVNWVNFGGQSAAGDQTYRFTAPAAGGYTITASPTLVGFDAMLILLADNCTTLGLFSAGSASDANGSFNGTPGSGDESFEAIMTAGQSVIAVVQDFNFFGGTMDFSIAGTSNVAEWSMF